MQTIEEVVPLARRAAPADDVSSPTGPAGLAEVERVGYSAHAPVVRGRADARDDRHWSVLLAERLEVDRGQLDEARDASAGDGGAVVRPELSELEVRGELHDPGVPLTRVVGRSPRERMVSHSSSTQVLVTSK